LHKSILLKYDGSVNRAYVYDVWLDDETIEVLVNPNTEFEFYAELYFDNYGEWEVVEVFNSAGAGIPFEIKDENTSQ